MVVKGEDFEQTPFDFPDKVQNSHPPRSIAVQGGKVSPFPVFPGRSVCFVGVLDEKKEGETPTTESRLRLLVFVK